MLLLQVTILEQLQIQEMFLVLLEQLVEHLILNFIQKPPVLMVIVLLFLET